MAARILVGTSGYSYGHWRGVLYPREMSAGQWLNRYSEAFGSVELNATFYRLPSELAVDAWRDGTPPGFVFACKGSRFLTHLKRLTDVSDGVHRYFDRIARLGPKLGPVLWQLPPQMDRVDLPRLELFLAALPAWARHAVEFRSATWYRPDVCDLLDDYRAAFCEHDLVKPSGSASGALAPPRRTGGFRYLRFHGLLRYAGRYPPSALTATAKSLARSRDAGQDSFIYFNNDGSGHAVMDALALCELLGQEVRQALRPEAGSRACASAANTK